MIISLSIFLFNVLLLISLSPFIYASISLSLLSKALSLFAHCFIFSTGNAFCQIQKLSFLFASLYYVYKKVKKINK